MDFSGFARAHDLLTAETTASTPRIGKLYHGCWAGQAEAIHRAGLLANNGYVHLAGTEGLAWAYGAWATGMVLAAGLGVDDVPDELRTGKVGGTVAAAMRAGGSNLGAVCTVQLPTGFPLEQDPQTGCPALPWEDNPRVAPCFRTDGAIPARWITGWQLFRVPELTEPGMLDRLTGKADRLAAEYPRGHALLEDLAPHPIGDAIPNGRRLVAAVLDAAGPAAELAYHGPPHWGCVAARGLELHPDSDLTVVLLFALLHDACRQQDGTDPGHGARAASLARRLNGDAFTLDPDRLELLAFACAHHTDGLVSDDPTVGCAWDADRLDLAQRYGLRHLVELFSTARGRDLAATTPEPLGVAFRDVLAAYAAQLRDGPWAPTSV